MEINKQNFKTVISSEHRLLDLQLGELIRYKDLIGLFVKRNFIASYKQTVLGPLWAIIQPLLTTVVFTIVFGNLAGLTTADIPGSYAMPGFLFYMAGNICWALFSGVLSTTSDTFRSNRSVMSRVYYPRLVSPISSAISRLISFSIQFGMFALIWLFYALFRKAEIRLTLMALLIPVSILQLMILGTGCGMIISSVTTRYRDLAMLVGFGLQLWQYASPLAYGLELVNERWPHYLWLYMLNPVAPAITTFRYACFGFGYFNAAAYFISWAVTLAVFFIGLILFKKIERNFADTI